MNNCSNPTFDSEKHKYNINRRIMERDKFFNIDSKKLKPENLKKMGIGFDSPDGFFNGKEETTLNKNCGEITGMKFNSYDIEPGMPLRPMASYSSDKTIVQNNTDFDLFTTPTSTTTNVSYNDPSDSNKIDFANVNERTIIQDNLENYNLPVIFNNFSFEFIYIFFDYLKVKKSFGLAPFNIIQLLSILYIGSKGSTEDILKKFFFLPNKMITLKNLLVINSELKKSTLILSTGDYSSIKNINLILIPKNIILNENFIYQIDGIVNFIKVNQNNPIGETAKYNSFIKQSTNNLIVDLITPDMFNHSVSLVIINCFYFYCKWKMGFNIKSTNVELFNNKEKVYMMQQRDINHKYFEDKVNQILEMDYIDSSFSFGIVLPKTNKLPIITNEQLQFYISQLNVKNISNIKIPRFRQETRYKIGNLFKKKGLRELFEKINIGDIVSSQNQDGIFISEIIHCCLIIVDEAGTETATSSQNCFKNLSNSINFIANHPFLYYIRYKPQNLIMFIGIYQ